jgi:hemoglobin/transferrin/lactoferrin receptor protein
MRHPVTRARHTPCLALLLSFFVAPALLAQTSGGTAPDTAHRQRSDSARKIAKLAPISVTATRSEKLVFRTAAPLLVVDSSVIRREAPNGIADLFRNLPGMDVTGVGPNQTRLMVRGQRGQRILLAEDGIRLNNSRRQQDFGELPAFTDVNGIARVEILRGPASVLYGTDAIGGVVNQITVRPPAAGAASGVQGSLLYRYGSADEQHMVHGQVAGRTGRLGYVLGAGYRNAGTYNAPGGTFGLLHLAPNTRVNDTGVKDQTYGLALSYDLAQQSALSLRVSRYDASEAGFGYVNPAALGDQSGVLVRLLYPKQDVTRIVAGYRASALHSVLADRLSVTAYTTQNARTFDQQIDIPFGDPFPAGAGIKVRSRNRTNIGTYGARVEAVKVMAGRHIVTYGVDWFLDHSNNQDTSATTTTTFGAPKLRSSTMPTVPNANAWSGGAYAQADFQVAGRFDVGVGVRAQTTRSNTRETPGLAADRAGISASTGTVVGGVSGQFRLTPRLNLVASAGRAFRAPNLVERYFDGVTAEGNGYLSANPDLKPETSLNYDFGVKYRRDRFYGEVIYFINTISDGIRITPLGTKINNFPAFQNQNIAKLRDQGLEVLAEVDLGAGLSGIGHYTKLDSKNADANSPLGDSYASKLGGELAWHDVGGRFFVAYEVRHQGERKDIVLVGSPVGDKLPPFTVHTVRATYRLPTVIGTTPALGLTVANLTNTLYAESSNTSFFRPESRRSAIVTMRFDF